MGGVYADGGARDPSVLGCNRSSRTEARGGCSSLKSNGCEKGLVKEIVHDPGCGSVTRTSSSSRRNCSWQLGAALARAKFGRSCKWISRQIVKDPDGLTSFCGRYSETVCAVGSRRRATLRLRCIETSIHVWCRCGQFCEACTCMGASACSRLLGSEVHETRTRGTFYSCTVKPRPSRPSEIASQPTRCQKEPPFQILSHPK